MKISKLLFNFSFILTGMTILISCSNDKKSEKSMAPKGMNDPQMVKYIVLKDTTISETIQITGTVQAEESIDLRTEMSGKITKILFTEGSKVKQGDVLLKINDEELKAQIDRAKARLQLATEQEFRQKTLLNKEAISQQEYDLVYTEL